MAVVQRVYKSRPVGRKSQKWRQTGQARGTSDVVPLGNGVLYRCNIGVAQPIILRRRLG